MSSIYVKNFETNEYKEYSIDRFPYVLSRSIPEPIDWDLFVSTMESKNIPKNEIYVWCPLYMLKNRNITPDYQVSVTGSPLIHENILDAFNRELGEEIGMGIKDLGELDVCDNTPVNYASVDMRNTFPIVDTENLKGKDNKRLKVSLYVHGSNTQALKYCNYSIKRLRDPKEHKFLTHVCIIPLEYLVVQMKSKIEKTHL